MKLDIAICGCGPAGLATALLLHRQGHRVVLFERFDVARPVGSGLILQPTGLGVLAELGLSDHVIKRGARIDRLLGKVVPSDRTVLDVRYSDLGAGWHGVAVHRASLFEVLHSAVSAQIEMVLNKTINGMEAGSKAHLLSHDQRVGSFDLIVDCMGANSPLIGKHAKRKTLSFGALWTNVQIDGCDDVQHDVLEQRYIQSSHMTGILPIGKLANSNASLAAVFWSLKRDRLEHWRRSGLEVWKQEVASLWPMAGKLLASITSIEEVTFAQYDHFTLKYPCDHRFVHIGDAAHATSPQLGKAPTWHYWMHWHFRMRWRQIADSTMRYVNTRQCDDGMSVYSRR